MIVDELLTKLAYGELSNLAMSKGGFIIEEKHPVIINHANEGLLRLYSQFILKESELLLEEVEHITAYHLKKEYTESQGNPDVERYLYIKDMGNDPFQEDVIKVLSLYSEDGKWIPLNDPEHKMSYYTPQAQVIQSPAPITGRSISVIYQASHPPLTVDDLSQEIELPLVLNKALTAYIAANVFGDMNGQENMAKAQEQNNVFVGICNAAIERDLVNSSYSSSNVKFNRKGWV